MRVAGVLVDDLRPRLARAAARHVDHLDRDIEQAAFADRLG